MWEVAPEATRALVDAGFAVECVCPSERLNAHAIKKLPQGTPVHQVIFEDFSSNKEFDMLIFSESFHYIRLNEALRQAGVYARRYMLIFDYFRRNSDGAAEDVRGSYGVLPCAEK